MGKKIVSYYQLAEKLGGLPAKVKLAAKTCVASAAAETIPDTPKLLEQFQKALREIFPGAAIPD
jgi:hypothetical protein